VKTKVSYTINEGLAKDFAKITDQRHINRSALVEGMLKRWVNRQRGKSAKSSRKVVKENP